MSDALDLDPHDIANFKPWLSGTKCRHAAWRAGRDDVAWFESEYCRQRFDQGGTIEDQVSRIGGFPNFAVHKRLDVVGNRIWHFIGRDDHGSHRAMRVQRFS